MLGHHPLDELDVLDFTSLVQQHGFSLYLNGHSHLLNVYTLDNQGAYVTSGAGSLVNTVDQTYDMTAAKVAGNDLLVNSLMHARPAQTADATPASPPPHSYQTVYTNKVAGFTTHTFNSDFTLLTTELVSYTGEVVYSFVSDKSGKIENR